MTKYDEFYYKTGDMISSITDLNDKNYMQKYRDNIFCPDYRVAKLTFVNAKGKVVHLRTTQGSMHEKYCPYAYESADTQVTTEYLKELQNNKQIHNLMQSAMRYLCISKNVTTINHNIARTQSNLMIIEPKQGITTTRKSIKRKSLNAYFDEENVGELFVFYGKVMLKFKKEKSWKAGYLQIVPKEKIKFSITIFDDMDIEENTLYNLVAIGMVKNNKPIFQIELFNKNCLLYKKDKFY